MTTTTDLESRITDQLTTKHAVDDLGWDPNGNEPIDIPYEDGLLIEVPKGTYFFDDTHSGSPTAWGLRGTGDDPEDVRFVGPDRALRALQLTRGSRDILVDNVAFDHGDAIPGCLGNAFLCDDGLCIRDVHYLGTTPAETSPGGATAQLPVSVFEADGVAILDGVEMTGPSELADYPRNPLAVFSGAETEGTIYVRDSRFANRGEHAIYASRCPGAVRIENCHFENNQNTHARISGPGSYVKNSTFVWDVDNHPNHGSFQATTGLTFESGFQGFTGGLVENCEFICKSSSRNSGCLKIDGSHGSVTVRDCTFDVPDDVTPIFAQAPGDSFMIDGIPDEPHALAFNSVHVTSVGKPDGWSDAAVDIDGRDGTTLTDCCVSADGRDALCCMDGTYDVVGGALAATGDRARIGGSGLIRQEGVGVEADCATDTDGLREDSGETGGSGDDTMIEHAYDLLVKGTDGVTHYEIDVSGEAGFVSEGDFKANPGSGDLDDRLEGEPGGPTTIQGAVAKGGGDSYTFDGTVVDVRVLEGADPSVVVDGERLDLSQFRDSGEEDGTADPEPEPTTEQTVVVEATGTKGYLEPVIFFDGEIATLPSGESYTLFADRGELVFSTREGWRHEFVVAGTVTDAAVPPGVSVTVDGVEWVEG